MQEESNTKNHNEAKVNLSDHSSVKNLIDDSVSEIVTSRGYVEDTRLSDAKLLIGTIVITIALFAQFYKKKFPENSNFLIGCIILYIVINGMLHLISHMKEKNVILFTHPPALTDIVRDTLFLAVIQRSFGTGLVVSSKLPRFSDLYTLTIASADPKSIFANKTVEFTKSVTKWFTKEGVLVESLLWKEVDGLINDYAREPRKSK